jgi:hypothetical protein
MPDTFPLLQKEGKHFYPVSHSSPMLKVTLAPLQRGELLQKQIVFGQDLVSFFFNLYPA